ncbi:hypothetical protein GGX14DRAFT_677251 [Mycena pura]|uniref:Uncharacterized protein n=1 Tax=Mycena pura TaxID=153505 RepID=A0AAD6Y0F5_9AGAR|nr:hypothetical protein GGX14DRAFT_677251 [Mycena pura]
MQADRHGASASHCAHVAHTAGVGAAHTAWGPFKQQRAQLQKPPQHPPIQISGKTHLSRAHMAQCTSSIPMGGDGACPKRRVAPFRLHHVPLEVQLGPGAAPAIVQGRRNKNAQPVRLRGHHRGRHSTGSSTGTGRVLRSHEHRDAATSESSGRARGRCGRGGLERTALALGGRRRPAARLARVRSISTVYALGRRCYTATSGRGRGVRGGGVHVAQGACRWRMACRARGRRRQRRAEPAGSAKGGGVPHTDRVQSARAAERGACRRWGGARMACGGGDLQSARAAAVATEGWPLASSECAGGEVHMARVCKERGWLAEGAGGVPRAGLACRWQGWTARVTCGDSRWREKWCRRAGVACSGDSVQMAERDGAGDVGCADSAGRANGGGGVKNAAATCRERGWRAVGDGVVQTAGVTCRRQGRRGAACKGLPHTFLELHSVTHPAARTLRSLRPLRPLRLRAAATCTHPPFAVPIELGPGALDVVLSHAGHAERLAGQYQYGLVCKFSTPHTTALRALMERAQARLRGPVPPLLSAALRSLAFDAPCRHLYRPAHAHWGVRGLAFDAPCCPPPSAACACSWEPAEARSMPARPPLTCARSLQRARARFRRPVLPPPSAALSLSTPRAAATLHRPAHAHWSHKKWHEIGEIDTKYRSLSKSIMVPDGPDNILASPQTCQTGSLIKHTLHTGPPIGLSLLSPPAMLRFTGSPLVSKLKLRIPALRNEQWREWENQLPPECEELIKTIAAFTNENLTQSSGFDLFARIFGQYETGNYSGTSVHWNRIGDIVIGLQVLDLIGCRLGIAQNLSDQKHYTLEEVQFTGRLDWLVKKMSNWPEALTNAVNLYTTHGTVKHGLKPSGYQTIIRNFHMGAFTLGWYFSGRFSMPDTLEEFFTFFKENGFEDEIAESREEMIESFKTSKLKTQDFQRPIQLGELFTYLLFLLPVDLRVYKYNVLQLIQISQCLGIHRPQDIALVEQAIRDALWDMAAGKQPAQEVFKRVFELIEAINLQDHEDVDWFTSTLFPRFEQPGSFSEDLAAAYNTAASQNNVHAEEDGPLQGGSSSSKSQVAAPLQESTVFDSMGPRAEGPQQPEHIEEQNNLAHPECDYHFIPDIQYLHSDPIIPVSEGPQQLEAAVTPGHNDLLHSESARSHHSTPVIQHSTPRSLSAEPDNTNVYGPDDSQLSHIVLSLSGTSIYSALGDRDGSNALLNLDSSPDASNLPSPLSSTAGHFNQHPQAPTTPVTALILDSLGVDSPCSMENASPRLTPLFNEFIDQQMVGSPLPQDASGTSDPLALLEDFVGLSGLPDSSSFSNLPYCSDSLGLVTLPEEPPTIFRNSLMESGLNTYPAAMFEAEFASIQEVQGSNQALSLRRSTRSGTVGQPKIIIPPGYATKRGRHKQSALVVDLTGSDDLRVNNLKSVLPDQRPKKDPVGMAIRVYGIDYGSTWTHHFHGFLAESEDTEAPWKTDHQVIEKIIIAFERTFVEVESKLIPRFWLDAASCLDYIPGCSMICKLTAEQYRSTTTAQRLKVLEHRHIHIKALAAEAVPLEQSFDILGIRPNSLLEMHDIAYRTAEKASPLKVGTAQEFLEEAQKPDGMVLSCLDIPMGDTDLPDVEGFNTFNTSGKAKRQTRNMTGAQWLTDRDYGDRTRFGVATTTNASTPWHMDPALTMVELLNGSKAWCVADNGYDLPGLSTPGRMDTMYGLDGWDAFDSATENRNCEVVVLEGRDALNSYGTSNLISLLDALDWQNYLDINSPSIDGLNKADIANETLRRAKYQTQHRAWFCARYKVLYHDQDGITLNIEQDIFQKSVVHLAVVLTFYQRVDYGVERKAKKWTTDFETKISEALGQYETRMDGEINPQINTRLVSLYKTALTCQDPPSMGRFIPSEWTDNAYKIEVIQSGGSNPGGKRKSMKDAAITGSQKKSRLS